MEKNIYLNRYESRYATGRMEMQTKRYIDGWRNMQIDSWMYIGR